MRYRLRRIFVCVLTIAFFFSGAAAWRGCIETSTAQLAPVAASHDHQHGPMMAGAADHGAHYADSGDVALLVASDQAQQQAPDHACLKCCSMCTVAGVTSSIAATPVIIFGAIISFGVGQHDLIGHVAALDPGIPKYIV